MPYVSVFIRTVAIFALKVVICLYIFKALVENDEDSFDRQICNQVPIIRKLFYKINI